MNIVGFTITTCFPQELSDFYNKLGFNFKENVHKGSVFIEIKYGLGGGAPFTFSSNCKEIKEKVKLAGGKIVKEGQNTECLDIHGNKFFIV